MAVILGLPHGGPYNSRPFVGSTPLDRDLGVAREARR